MIRILCVEDTPASAQIIRGIAEDCLKGQIHEITLVETLQEAKKQVQQKIFDVAIIDIQIPIREGEPPKADGGVLFLDHVLTSTHAHRPRYIVGVTAEKDRFEEAQPKFTESLFALLQRDPSNDAWISQLTRFLTYIASQNVNESDNSGLDNALGGIRPALAIVCALPETELKAVLNWWSCDWKENVSSTDSTAYFVGTLNARSGQHTIVAAAAAEPGMACSASLTTKMILRFRPRFIAMAGIAAGITENIGFGDIIVADQTWDYTTGKIIDSGSLSESRAIKCDSMVVGQVRTLGRSSEFLSTLHAKWPAEKPTTQLQVHVGPMASGGAVIETNRVVQEVRSRDRKTIGLDMEAHGVATAAWYSLHPPTNVLVAKSAVDRGVPPKTDRWHSYAAYTSAMFLREWATRYL